MTTEVDVTVDVTGGAPGGVWVDERAGCTAGVDLAEAAPRGLPARVRPVRDGQRGVPARRGPPGGRGRPADPAVRRRRVDLGVRRRGRGRRPAPGRADLALAAADHAGERAGRLRRVGGGRPGDRQLPGAAGEPPGRRPRLRRVLGGRCGDRDRPRRTRPHRAGLRCGGQRAEPRHGGRRAGRRAAQPLRRVARRVLGGGRADRGRCGPDPRRAARHRRVRATRCATGAAHDAAPPAVGRLRRHPADHGRLHDLLQLPRGPADRRHRRPGGLGARDPHAVRDRGLPRSCSRSSPSTPRSSFLSSCSSGSRGSC